MDRLSAPPSMFKGLSGYAALALACVLVIACGDPSCPAGSTKVNGRCEPASTCRAGEVEENGECVDESPSTMGDAGRDAAEVPDPQDAGGDAAEIPDATDQDTSVMESADPLCDSVECGDHGACQIIEGQAQCVCEDGFEGELCDSCEAGLVLDGDECVAPCDASSAPDCGENGECEAGDEEAFCVCEHPFAGAQCAECAEGFALQTDGSCAPDCGECGAHEMCNEELMTPSCECVAGYADQVGGCAWVGDGETGGIVDGDLTDPAAWTTKQVNIADGEATFDNVRVGGRCVAGVLEQSIVMPAFEDSEQLVLEVAVRTTCTSTAADECPGLQLEVGDTAQRLLIAGGASPVETSIPVCLGDAAYAEEVSLRIRPSLPYRRGAIAFECDQREWPALESLRIRPAAAGECPAVGTALGTLASATGWKLSSATISTSNVLTVSGTAETLVNVPSQGGLAVRVTGNASALVTIEGLLFEYVLGATVSRCLPEWTHGSVAHIGFATVFDNATVSSFVVESDAACSNVSFDRGFERIDASRTWDTTVADSMALYPNAYQGDRALRSATAANQAYGLGRFPALDAPNQGLALTARYRLAATNLEGTYTIAYGKGSSSTTTSSAWNSAVLCADEQWESQLAVVQLTSSARVVAGTNQPVFWFDDAGLTTVPSNLCD